ncbi:MAG: hypothetical protein HQ512_14870 [Rhodospirillales bacterium]|nr:hypothetical protein [Rhodospirillales bacterium]
MTTLPAFFSGKIEQDQRVGEFEMKKMTTFGRPADDPMTTGGRPLDDPLTTG